MTPQQFEWLQDHSVGISHFSPEKYEILISATERGYRATVDVGDQDWRILPERFGGGILAFVGILALVRR